VSEEDKEVSNEQLRLDGRWVTVEDAATALGINQSTVRRRIRERKLQSQRLQRPQGYILRVFLPNDQVAGHSYLQAGDEPDGDGEASYAQLPAPLQRAEAITAYNTALIAPLVQELAETRRRLEELANANGHLAAELAAAQERLAILEAPKHEGTVVPTQSGSLQEEPEAAESREVVAEANPEQREPWWRRFWQLVSV
jgi:hypothetical protein